MSFNATERKLDMKGIMSGKTLWVGVMAGTLGLASGILKADGFSTNVKRQIEKVKATLSEVEQTLDDVAGSIEQADKDADVLIDKIRTGTDPKEVAAELKRLIAALDAADARTTGARVRLGDVRSVLNGLRGHPSVQGSKLLSAQVQMLFDSVATLEKTVDEVTEDAAAVRAKLAGITALAGK